jgi:hypothetical protein
VAREMTVMAEDASIVNAQRLITSAGVYIVFVGCIGLLAEPVSGALALLIGGAVLGGAWLVQIFQSRLAAAALLVGAVLYFVLRLRSWGSVFTVALVLPALWVLAGVFAVFATVRYHLLAHRGSGA